MKGATQEETDLERVKHHFRIREVLIDKGVLALILCVLGFVANARLEAYKTTLQVQLDDLRTSREKRRVLAEREVAAHENVWKALVELRHFLAPKLGKALDGSTEQELTAQVFKFGGVVEAEELYLGEPLRNRVEHFVDPTLAEFVVNWQSAPGAIMTKTLWDGLTRELESIGTDVRSAIYDRRSGRDLNGGVS